MAVFGKSHYTAAVLKIMSEMLSSFSWRNEYCPAILILC